MAKIETMACHGCGIEESINLIDGKDDGTGNFNRLECVKCYGPGWNPCAIEHIAESVQPSLRPFYDGWWRAQPRPFMVNTPRGFFSGRTFHRVRQ